MKDKRSVKMLVEASMMIALSMILYHITIYTAPQGGSVTAGSMVPLFIFALRWGMGPGILVGAGFGILELILRPFIFHPVQVLLDYPIAYGLLGLAGIGYRSKNQGLRSYIRIILGIILAISGRMLSHVLSGVIFFGDATGGQNPWIYSLIYNGSFLIPEMIISIIVLVLVWGIIQRRTI